MKRINVAKDFTRFPSGRYASHGDTSGEAFRKQFLEKPLSKGEQVYVELDGTIGYSSSFLEEAFGGLVRSLRMDSLSILNLLHFQTDDDSLREEIEQYIKDAKFI